MNEFGFDPGMGLEQYMTKCGFPREALEDWIEQNRRAVLVSLRLEETQGIDPFRVMSFTLFKALAILCEEHGESPGDLHSLAEFMAKNAPRDMTKHMVMNMLRMMGPDGTEVTGDGVPEALGQSIDDLIQMRGYKCAQIADELDSGRYWL